MSRSKAEDRNGKTGFSRKRSIFCGPLEKELRKRLVKCFVWRVALYGAKTWTLRRKEQKQLEAVEKWIWRRLERVKCTDKIKNAVVLKEEGKKLAGSLANKELPAEGCSRRKGKREEGSRQKKISDDRQHHDKWTVSRYEKEGHYVDQSYNFEDIQRESQSVGLYWHISQNNKNNYLSKCNKTLIN